MHSGLGNVPVPRDISPDVTADEAGSATHASRPFSQGVAAESIASEPRSRIKNAQTAIAPLFVEQPAANDSIDTKDVAEITMLTNGSSGAGACLLFWMSVLLVVALFVFIVFRRVRRKS